MEDFVIERRLVNTRLEPHDRIALAFSGGKDSLACAFLCRTYFDRITLYHVDTGDYLPEQRAVIDTVENEFPYRFVRIQTNVEAWINRHGLPSDLIPYTQHPYGVATGMAHTRLVHRFDCCHFNMMLPLYQRIIADENTLLVRGTKACDMPRLPIKDGEVENGVEIYHPLEAWSDAEVLKYLRLCGVTSIEQIYQHLEHGLSCATCPAWWNESRAGYLKQFHPKLYQQYDARLQLIAAEVAPSLAWLKRELEA